MAEQEIVKFYIMNYVWNDAVVTSETLFQTVPFSGNPVINNPKVKNEMGKSGSFEFEIDMASPYYDAFIQMKTIMRVVYFGHTIFRGRVLTIDKKLDRTRTVHCEGDFSFLLDSWQEGTEEKNRHEMTVYTYLQNIISQHNSCLQDEPVKHFVLGEVPGQYSQNVDPSQKVDIPSEREKLKFGDTSYNSSMDRIEEILNEYHGYFRTRYDENQGTTYLDWFDNFYNSAINTQTIEVSKNLIDLSGSTEVENLFTIVIPIGKKNSKSILISDYWPIVDASHPKVNYIKVPELASVPLYSDDELNSSFHRKEEYLQAIDRYGYIYKSVTFDNANTPKKLFEYAKDWIKNNYMPQITQWDVTALDMKILNSENQVLLCGDRINLKHPEVDQTFSGLTAISAEYDLYNPDKDKYTIGILNSQINKSYGVKNNTGKGTGGGITTNPDDNEHGDAEADIAYIKSTLTTQYALKTEGGGADIRLDDPLAFMMFNTDGTEKDEDDILKLSNEDIRLLAETRLNNPGVYAEAIRLGLSVDDPQVLINLTPSVKAKQEQFKSEAEWYFINTVGLDHQQANVLLNESAGQSWLAELTDDEGNWTDYALSQGAMMWSEDFKEQSIATREILSGEKKSEGGLTLGGILSNSTGLDINIGGGLLTSNYAQVGEEIKKELGIGEDGNLAIFEEATNTVNDLKKKGADFLSGAATFISEEKEKASGTGTFEEKAIDMVDGLISGNNTEDGGKEVEIKSDTVEVDGKQDGGSMAIGPGDLDGWRITLNQPITYTYGEETFTVPAGSVACDDFHFTQTYSSLKAKLLVVDVLLADYAKINTLEALKASVDELTADTIHADTRVSAWNGNFTNLYGVYIKGSLMVKSSHFQYLSNPLDTQGTEFIPMIYKQYRFSKSGSYMRLQGIPLNSTSWSTLASFNIDSIIPEE